MGTRFRHAFHFPIQKFDDEIGLYKNFRYLEDFLQQLAEQDGQGPTTILAPSDYSNPELANVVLNGRTDAAVINELLLVDGWIHILPGTVKLETGLITPSASSGNINKITGSGWSTILKVTASISNAIFFSFQQRLTIRDLVIDCDSKTSTAGLSWDAVIDMHIDRVWIKNSSARGFRAVSGETYSLVNCLASNNGTVGFDLQFDSDNQDARVIGCTARDNTGSGFTVAESTDDSGVLVGCVSTDNGGWGFDMNTNKTILNVGYVASGNSSGNVRSGGGSAHGIEEQVYVPGDHAALNVESFSTASTDVSTSLKPDGAGSVEFVDSDHATDLLNVGVNTHTNIDDFLDFFNGTFMEAFDATVSESGGTVSLDLAKVGGGNLTTRFSSGLVTHTAGAIALTTGSDTSPTENFIYILATSPTTLVKSTSAWPTGEHIKVAYLVVPSSTFVAANGVYVNQNWNDFAMNAVGQGHLSHVAERARRTHAEYFTGINGNGTQGYLTPTAGAVDLITTAGIVYQLHEHTFNAFTTVSAANVALVKNWSGDAYHDITNLYDIVADSTGATIGNNKYFNLIIWGVANKTGQYSPLIINLPAGTYHTAASAAADDDNLDDFDIPDFFHTESSTGFLIARITIQMKTGGGTWSNITTTDLRGFSSLSATGGAAATVTEFADNVFNIHDETDETKELSFNVGANVSTATHRVVTIQDADGTMEFTGHAPESHSGTGITGAELEDLSDGGATTLHKHDHGGQDGLADDDHTNLLNSTRHSENHSAMRIERATTAQTVSNSTVTTVIFNSERFQNDTKGDLSRNLSTGVITIDTTGVYEVTAGLRWVNNNTGNRYLILKLNGTTTIAEGNHAASGEGQVIIATIWEFTATDTIEMQVFQNSGGNLNIQADARTYFTVHKL